MKGNLRNGFVVFLIQLVVGFTFVIPALASVTYTYFGNYFSPRIGYDDSVPIYGTPRNITAEVTLNDLAVTNVINLNDNIERYLFSESARLSNPLPAVVFLTISSGGITRSIDFTSLAGPSNYTMANVAFTNGVITSWGLLLEYRDSYGNVLQPWIYSSFTQNPEDWPWCYDLSWLPGDGATITSDGASRVRGAWTLVNSSAVPIPGAVWLLGSSLVGLIGLKRKRLG